MKKNGELYTVNPESRVIITFDADDNEEIYLHLGNYTISKENHRTNTYVNGIELKSYAGWADSDEKLICIGANPNQNTIEITFQYTGDIMLNDIDVYALNINEIQQLCTERHRKELQNIEVDSNKIKGNISIDKPEILFFGVPYSIGWHAYVDGQEVDTIRADYGFIALELDKGVHDVELVYRSPGLRVGAIIAIMTFMGLLIWQVRKKNI